MIRKCPLWLLPIFLLIPVIASAELIAPDELVKNVTNEVLVILREDKGIQSGNQQQAVTLIEQKVAPHFDFPHMTRLAVGHAWRQADEEQRKALSGEFRTLLVRTYANTLISYRDQTVSFKPSPKPAAGDEVTVRCQINKPGAPPIPLDYSLARSEGDWIARRDGTPRTEFAFDDAARKGDDPAARSEEPGAHFLGKLETFRHRRPLGKPIAEGIEVVEKHEVFLVAA